jgi:hypothetical protein
VRLRLTHIPRAIWPVGCGISAYVGARYGAGMATAIWAALALVAMAYAFYVAAVCRIRARHELDAVEREANAERAALSIGRRAPWVMLTVVDNEGKRFSRTLAQVLTDATPEGRDMLWDTPAYAVLYFLDPGWRYEEEDRA